MRNEFEQIWRCQALGAGDDAEACALGVAKLMLGGG
jgi:hypothetical protein